MDRAALVDRWLDLTRRQLPAAAARHGWPIRFDHCFMRVCLDTVYGRPWHEVVARPALEHADLARAIAVAERLLAEPEVLDRLNRASIAARKRSFFYKKDQKDVVQ